MASAVIYGSGLNLTGTVFQNGPALAQLEPAYFSGAVQWLDTIGGNNANAGSEPELPVKTIAQAVTNSTANGLIVIGEGSTESLPGSQSFATAGIYVIGCGIGNLRPRYTCTGAVSMFAASAAGIRFRNLYFPASTAAATARINFTAASGEVRECYVECGASDSGSGVIVGANAHNTHVKDTTFLSTALRPANGLLISGDDTDCRVERCIFDGGTYGWTTGAFKVTGGAVRLGVEDVSLLRRSDYSSVTGCTYQIFGLNQDGTNRVSIAA